MSVREFRRQISDSRVYDRLEQSQSGKATTNKDRSKIPRQPLQRGQSVPIKDVETKKRSREFPSKKLTMLSEEDAIEHIQNIFYSLQREYPPVGSGFHRASPFSRSHSLDPLEELLKLPPAPLPPNVQGGQAMELQEPSEKFTIAPPKAFPKVNLALRRGQSLDENSPSALSPDRKRTKNAAAPPRPPLTTTCRLTRSQSRVTPEDWLDLPAVASAPTLQRQALSELPTTNHHRRKFTPINVPRPKQSSVTYMGVAEHKDESLSAPRPQRKHGPSASVPDPLVQASSGDKSAARDAPRQSKTIGPGFPLLNNDVQRTPAMFAELLKAKKSTLRATAHENEAKTEEPISVEELKARDEVWSELQTLVKDHFLEVENSRVHRDKELGRGKWSAVYAGRLDRQRSQDGNSPLPQRQQVVAIKEATYDSTRYHDKPPLHTMQEFSREIKVLCALQHPNMPRLHGVVFQPKLGILLELLDQGSLTQNVKNESNPSRWAFEISLAEKLELVYDVASALAALHEHHIIHRDVKGHNVLLTRQQPHGWQAKLADFGTSVVLQQSQVLTDMMGTIGYTAPEIYGDVGYSFPADVFSFAIVAWEIFSVGPEDGADRIYALTNPLSLIRPERYAEAVANGVRPHIHASVPRGLQDLITQCWSTEAQDRPTMDTAVHIVKQIIAETKP